MSRGLPVAGIHDPAGLAFIALGSNLGDGVALVRSAFERLEALSAGRVLRSSLWRSSPVDCPPDSPPFVNAAAGLAPQPGESPESLLAKLQHLEAQFGRHPKRVLNEPRPLDLDLLTFADTVCHTAQLTLPHPRAHLRRFVLAPLAEIAPNLRLPRQTQTVAILLTELHSPETLTRLA